MREVIEFHLDGLRQDGAPIPKPSASAAYVYFTAMAGHNGLRRAQVDSGAAV